MKRKLVTGIVLTLLSISMLTLAFGIQPVRASETIYIRADGRVDPSTAPIQRVGDVYTFTNDVYDSVVVQKNHIVIDGASYTVLGTGTGTGIDLSYRTKVTLKNIEVTNFERGIYLYASSNNVVTGSTVSSNTMHGIQLVVSSNYNIICGNSITGNNWYGLEVAWSSDYNIISGNDVTYNKFGIWLWKSSNNAVSGNSITGNNQYGIWLYSSADNIISGNTVTNNMHGVELGESSNYNIICGNSITGNNWYGLEVAWSSDYNIISGNDVTYNKFGIWLWKCTNNKIYHNNFADNTIQVYSYDSANIWDDGYPSGGNYWSDYTGTDANGDGIGDTPYFINPNNQDNYPFVEPWSPELDPVEAIQELIETIRSWNLPDGTENSLTSKLRDAVNLLNMENENGAIRKLMDFIDGTEALRSKNKIENWQANYLVTETQRIINLI